MSEVDGMIGRTVSHYRIVGALGAGGMGVVYRAEDRKLGRQVALKFLSQDFSRDRRALERLQREARAASAMNHANICTIHDIDEFDGQPFIVMEFLEGQSIRERIAGKPFRTDELVDVAVQISDALDAAHTRGIVHRDIKPANLFLTQRGQVKVLDFGLAKLAETKRAAEERISAMPTATIAEELLTRPGAAVGTVAYMSPEQARGEDLDARTDLFSFGVVLYEMATGRVPFQGNTLAVVFDAILHKTPVSPLRARPELPSGLGRIIDKALEKDRECRYQSAREMLVDLRNLERDTDSAPAAVPGSRPTRRWALAASGVAMAAAGVGGAWWLAGRRKPLDSLAVLPFVNRGADPNIEYLGEGVAESLINSLSQFPKLRVIARTTAFRYQGQNVDPQKVGRDLGVRAVLTGSVVKRGDTLSIQADLIDVENGSQLWGQRYNRPSSDIFSIQDDLAREISEKLRLKLTGEDTQRLTRHYTASAEAYEEYIRGRYHWNRRSRESMELAIECFRRAIGKDPAYALAYTGLADAYNLLPYLAPISPKETAPRAKAAAEKALALDESLAEAHTSLACYMHRTGKDWAGAGREFRRALELNPGYTTARHWYGLYLLGLGRFEAAMVEIRRARDADPLSIAIHGSWATSLYLARRYDEAIDVMRTMHEAGTSFSAVPTWTGATYLQKGWYPQAIEELQTGVKLFPQDGFLAGFLAHALARAGRKDEAMRVVDGLKVRSKREYVTPYGMALAYVGLGDKDQAFAWLDRACEEYSVWLFLAKVEPTLDPLRPDPRFGQVLRKLGLAP